MAYETRDRKNEEEEKRNTYYHGYVKWNAEEQKNMSEKQKNTRE